MQINPVQQRSRDFIQIFFHYTRAAHAFFFGVVVEAAGAPVRCIFVNLTLRCKRPINPAYPAKLETLGDHFRKIRLDRGLSQPEVARKLGVATDTITNWELNRYKPQTRFLERIFRFLVYRPLSV
jgi:DNA-binding XRE family transcriptional regulator